MTNRNKVHPPDIRDSDTETLNQTHRETNTETDRQRERHTPPQTHTDSDRGNRQTDRQTGGIKEKLTDSWNLCFHQR